VAISKWVMGSRIASEQRGEPGDEVIGAFDPTRAGAPVVVEDESVPKPAGVRRP